MSDKLHEKKCFKYLKVNNLINPDIINKYIDYKIKCDRESGARKVPLNDGTLINAEDLFSHNIDSYSYGNFKISDLIFHPSLLIFEKRRFFTGELFTGAGKSTSDNINEPCSLCKLQHYDGFKEYYDKKILFGNIYPRENETFLMWKDYYIVNNIDPKDSYNLMLIKSNHENYKIKGSQYEILSLETLNDVNDFTFLLRNNYRFGHNYANTGSQAHFHIQMLKNIDGVNYGLDNFIYNIGNYIDKKNIPNGNFEIPFTESNIFLNSNKKINLNNREEDPKTICTTVNIKLKKKIISLTKFKNNVYGYKGVLLHTNDYYKVDKEFNLILKNILNYIENTSKYTFVLYFPTNNNIFNNGFSVVIFPQLKNQPISFNNLMSNIPIEKNEKTYIKDELIENFQIYNYYIYYDFLTIDILENLIKPIIKIDNSIYSNTNVRNFLEFNKDTYYEFTRYTNSYYNKNLNGKIMSRENKLKIIIINSPIGMGKTRLYKNLKDYFDFYEEEKFVHINIDDIIQEIPEYNENLKKIKKILLKNILNEKIQTLDETITSSLKIKDLTESDNMLSLSLLDYEKLFNVIGNQIVEYDESKPITIKELANNAFNSIYNTRYELYLNICNFCETNNLNIVIETANFTYESLSTFFINFEFKFKKYLLTYYFDSNSEEMKKFNYRNVLLRSIYEGRFLEFNMIKERFKNWNNAYQSYAKKIPNKNIRKLNLTFKFKINFDNYQNSAEVNDIFNYINNHETDCIDMGNFEYYDPVRIDRKNKKTIYEKSINKIDYKFYCIQNKKLKYKEEVKDMKYKNICTDYITKFLLNESNNTYIINNTIKIFDEIINRLFKNKSFNLSKEVDKSDFKIVFKGGMNTSFFIKTFNRIFMNKLNLKNKNNNYKKIRKKFNIIENLTIFDDDEDNDIKNSINKDISSIARKSDLDFAILINKKKFNEKQYNEIKSYIIKMLNIYLWNLKKNLISTNFLYSLNIINKDDIKKFLQDNDLKNITFSKNSKDFMVINKNKDDNINIIPSHNHFLQNNQIIKNKDSNIVRYTIYDFDLPVRYKFKNSKISYNNSKIDILRLKANFKLTKTINMSQFDTLENDKIKDVDFYSRGEIIDITLDNYNNKSEIDEFKNLKEVKYSGMTNEFIFNVFSIDYLIKDLRKMLIGRYFPWLDKKYKKRLHRYFYLITMTMYVMQNKPLLVDEYLNFKKKNYLLEVKNELEKYCLVKLNEDNKLKEYYKLSRMEKLNEPFAKHKQECLKDFEIFKEDMNKIYNYYLNFYDQLKSVGNKEINDEIYKKLYQKNEFKINLWGGSNYNKLKVKYLKKKELYQKNNSKTNNSLSFLYKLNKIGGSVNFDFHSNINDSYLGNLKNVYKMRFSKNDVQEHYYSNDQHEFLLEFFNNWIKQLKIDNEGFTDNDITNSRSMSCGSFGCGVLFPHEKSGKKYIFKVIENQPIDELLKETYLGYYITGNKFKVSNRIIGFINSQDSNIEKFSSIIQNIKFDYNSIVPKRLENINLFILILEAGTGDFTNLSKHMLNQYGDNTPNKKITNIDKMNEFTYQVERIICQSLDINNFIKCHEIADKCVFFNHMDIKPPNFIFLFKDNNYNIQAIDFGLSKMNNYFYEHTYQFWTTPIIAETVFGRDLNDVKIQSPFYDLSATLLTVILSITYDPRPGSDLYDDNLLKLITDNLNVNNTQNYSKLNKLKNYIYDKLISIYTTNTNYFINKLCLRITEKLMYCYNIIVNISRFQKIVDFRYKTKKPDNNKKYLHNRTYYYQLIIDYINMPLPNYSFTSILLKGEDYDIYRKIIQISKDKLEYDKIMT